MIDIARTELKNAPYNPRKINDEARKKLKKKIEADGLVEPLIWNRRTGHLVGGHQRISILDSLERSQDYLLTVAVIDVDEKKEKELNVFLNNAEAQGEWDKDALDKLLGDMEGEIAGFGFDNLTLEMLLGKSFADTNDAAAGDVAVLKEARQATEEELKGIKERRASLKGKFAEENKIADASEMYVMLCFVSNERAVEFQKAFGLDETMRYHDGERFWSELKARGL